MIVNSDAPVYSSAHGPDDSHGDQILKGQMSFYNFLRWCYTESYIYG